MRLAATAGIDQWMLYDVLRASAGSSWMFEIAASTSFRATTPRGPRSTSSLRTSAS
ncbi:hypothetical protein [Rhizobium sp. CF142]|uniref:hypothetical protein n=1 Tax=Rhizobium sp. CF142 TaxID=1144314 RepID=UPI003296FAAD